MSIDDVDSSPPPTAPPPEDFSAASGSPLPPVTEAFPDYHDAQKPPPTKVIDSRAIPWPAIVAVAAASIAVILLLVTITVILTNPPGPNPSPTAAPPTTTMLVTTPSSVTMAPPPPETETKTETVTLPTITAAPPAPPIPQNCESTSQQLRAQANIDRPVVTAWAEIRWVPQLSSKRPGTFDDGQVWDCSSIWQEHQQLRLRYDAKLLWSGDWPTTFKKHDYWVTVAGMAYPTSDGAQAWCDSHGRDSDHCFPTLIQ